MSQGVEAVIDQTGNSEAKDQALQSQEEVVAYIDRVAKARKGRQKSGQVGSKRRIMY